jgi:hypothetical protein
MKDQCIEMAENMAGIDKVLEEDGASLMDLPGVVGVGQTEVDGRPCILVILERRSQEIEAAIPSTLKGYPVAVEVSGVILALNPPAE